MSRHDGEEWSPSLSILGPHRRSHLCLSIIPSRTQLLLPGLALRCAQEELGAAPHRGHSIAGLLSQQKVGAPSAELLFKPPVPEDGTLWTGRVEHPSWWVLGWGDNSPPQPHRRHGGNKRCRTSCHRQDPGVL